MLKEIVNTIKNSNKEHNSNVKITEVNIHKSSRKYQLTSNFFKDVEEGKPIKYIINNKKKESKVIKNDFYKNLKYVFENCGLDSMIEFSKLKLEDYLKIKDNIFNIDICSIKGSGSFLKLIEFENGDKVGFNKIDKNTWSEGINLKSEEVTNVLEYFAAVGYVAYFENKLKIFKKIEEYEGKNTEFYWNYLLIEIDKYSINSKKLKNDLEKLKNKKIQILYYIKDLLQFVNNPKRYDNILVKDFNELKKSKNVKYIYCIFSEIDSYYKWEKQYTNNSNKDNTSDVVFLYSDNHINLDNFFNSKFKNSFKSTSVYVTENLENNQTFYFQQVSLKKSKSGARIGKITTDIKKFTENKINESIFKKFNLKSITNYIKSKYNLLKNFIKSISNKLLKLLDINKIEKNINNEINDFLNKIKFTPKSTSESFSKSINYYINIKEFNEIKNILEKTIIIINELKTFKNKNIVFNNSFIKELETFKNILKDIINNKINDLSENEFINIIVMSFVLKYFNEFLKKLNDKKSNEIYNIIKDFERKSKLGNTSFNVYIDYLEDMKCEILKLSDFKIDKNVVINVPIIFVEFKMTTSKDKETKKKARYPVLNTYFIKDIATEPIYYHLQWNRNVSTFRVEYNSEKTLSQIKKIIEK